ncbi:hypothetical protein BC941DRAFT_406361 [Chlamydoabsidia padenii]|nr:hypothetical protein BC941DRAFT_406361 [Chlamydoabsidia padenii]
MPLLQLPIELLESIAAELDICTLWNLLDTCTYSRYSLLASTKIWKRLVFDLDSHGLHAVYAALRRFRDDNGHDLRRLVEKVVMDGTDDSMISPIVMLVKFPRLRILSAKHRRFNTNLETDTKILQELIKQGKITNGTLSLEQLMLYHYYMDNEPHLDAFQRTLDRLTNSQEVQLDIRRCYDPSLETLINTHLRLDPSSHGVGCLRIISRDALCWNCHVHLDRCWKCEPRCKGCKAKRLPPLANDNQRKQKLVKIKKQPIMDQELQEHFSLFE